MGHLPIQRVLHVGHLNSLSDLREGNLTAKNKKNSNAWGCARGAGGCWCYKLIGALYTLIAMFLCSIKSEISLQILSLSWDQDSHFWTNSVNPQKSKLFCSYCISRILEAWIDHSGVSLEARYWRSTAAYVASHHRLLKRVVVVISSTETTMSHLCTSYFNLQLYSRLLKYYLWPPAKKNLWNPWSLNSLHRLPNDDWRFLFSNPEIQNWTVPIQVRFADQNQKACTV